MPRYAVKYINTVWASAGLNLSEAVKLTDELNREWELYLAEVEQVRNKDKKVLKSVDSLA